jgi:hypothetical protein
VPVEHCLHTVLLGVAQAEVGSETLDVTGPGMVASGAVTRAVGQRGGGASHQSAEDEGRDQQTGGSEA